MKFLEFHENRAYSNETKLQNFLFNYIFLMKITDTHFSILFIWVTGLKEESRKTNEMVYIFCAVEERTRKRKAMI